METQQEASKTINVQEQPLVNDIETTAPGKLRVIKRNGKVVAFEEDKIKVAYQGISCNRVGECGCK